MQSIFKHIHTFYLYSQYKVNKSDNRWEKYKNNLKANEVNQKITKTKTRQKLIKIAEKLITIQRAIEKGSKEQKIDNKS